MSMMGHISTFSEKDFRFTHSASGSAYFTVSFFPIIYDVLSDKCTKYIEENGSKDQISIATRRASDMLL